MGHSPMSVAIPYFVCISLAKSWVSQNLKAILEWWWLTPAWFATTLPLKSGAERSALFRRCVCSIIDLTHLFSSGVIEVDAHSAIKKTIISHEKYLTRRTLVARDTYSFLVPQIVWDTVAPWLTGQVFLATE